MSGVLWGKAGWPPRILLFSPFLNNIPLSSSSSSTFLPKRSTSETAQWWCVLMALRPAAIHAGFCIRCCHFPPLMRASLSAGGKEKEDMISERDRGDAGPLYIKAGRPLMSDINKRPGSSNHKCTNVHNRHYIFSPEATTQIMWDVFKGVSEAFFEADSKKLLVTI